MHQLKFRIGNLFNYKLILVPLDINARGEGSLFRALPKLEVLRLFAFVKKEVFLQEPVSTCFSFLLNFRASQQAESQESNRTTTYRIPSEDLFQSLSNHLIERNLIALCEVDTEFFGLVDPMQVRMNNKDHCFLRLQVF